MNTTARLNAVRFQTKTPSGPRGHPVWDSMLNFQKDRLGFVTGVAREYGDVAQYRIAHLTFYQISHPDGVRRILQDNNHNYVRGALYELFKNMLGNDLPVSEGEFWLRQRRLMQPAFHHHRLTAFGELMTSLLGEPAGIRSQTVLA